jgi:uncharacterized protein DUF1761
MQRKVHFPAVLVAASVHWIFGALWFTFFKNAWIAGVGLTPTQVQNAQSHQSPVPYLVAFICSFGFAVVISRMITFSNMHGARDGARIGLMLGMGVAMLPMMTEYFFEMKHLNFALIAGGYPAVGGLMMGAILGAWQKKSATQTIVRKAAA